jgi:hypothetical protein
LRQYLSNSRSANRLCNEKERREAQEREMKFITTITAALRQFGGKLGPYLMIELLLPGGTLVAFALFLVRNWSQIRQLTAD